MKWKEEKQMPKRADCSLIGRHCRVLIIWSIFSQAEQKEQEDTVRPSEEGRESLFPGTLILSPFIKFPLEGLAPFISPPLPYFWVHCPGEVKSQAPAKLIGGGKAGAWESGQATPVHWSCCSSHHHSYQNRMWRSLISLGSEVNLSWLLDGT